MARTKLTVRRWPADFTRMTRTQKGRRICSFKIKLTLPQQKTVKKKKNGQIIKTINVRRKSKYFNGRSTRVFQLIKNMFLFLVEEN